MHYFLLALILLELPLQIDKYFFYDDIIAEVGSLGGLNVSITTICLGILYLGWIPQLVHESKFPDRHRLLISWPLVAYLGLTAFSFVMASDRRLSFFYFAMLTQSYLLYFYIANNVRSRGDVKFVCFFLVLGLVIQGVIMVTVEAIGHDIAIGPLEMSRDAKTLRMHGTLGSPILAASCLAMMITVSTGMLLSTKKNLEKAMALVALGLGGIGLILTQSRGSWVGTTLTCSLVVFFVWRKGWIPKRLMFAAVLAGVIAIFSFQGIILERIFGDDRGSAQSRLPLAEMALMIIQDHPFGVGVNNCATVAQHYQGRPQFREEWFFTIHCKYLLIWVETSLLGLIAFVAFLLTTVRTGWRGWKKWGEEDRFLAVISLSIGMAVIGQMLHMGVDVFSGRPQIQILWMIAALAAAIQALPLEESKETVVA